MNNTRILGIESSCDETAAAVVEDGSRILSSVVSSQIATHAKYGGVVPELASREHLRAIVPAVRLALEQAAKRLEDVQAIAVTQGPGLVGSLLVGITYAKALALVHKLPLIAVNHIEGHIHAVVSQNNDSQHASGEDRVEYPALALVVSGGHTHLYEVLEGFRYRLLGRTRDDAAGEAFDKVAKLLGFGYPGGPVIDALAPYGDPEGVRFTLAKMKGNTLDFSFSGIKTAVLRWVQAHGLDAEIDARRALLAARHRPTVEQWLQATPQPTLDLIASFQSTVIEELLRRAVSSADEIGARSVIISGGVACNAGLRIAARTVRLGYPVFFPEPGLSTDNAAMIAAAAYPKLLRGEFADWSLKADANLTLA
nr:tRNA (adenosine(37)-N6)-threonylcarbamoyltransferase complex [uncultured bacterium]